MLLAGFKDISVKMREKPLYKYLLFQILRKGHLEGVFLSEKVREKFRKFKNVL